MNERLIHLRIKIKSLAAEAAIIRQEAKKTSGLVKYGLNQHRTGIVREHTRINLLAYGLIKRVPYSVMEQKTDTKVNFSKIVEIAKRFGETDEIAINEWITAAKEHLASQAV